MEIVDVLEVLHANGTKRIELLLGDLSQIPSEHAVDVLVVSAFPGDYLPTPSSLIGALDRKGLSVAKLAERPAEDLTKDFSCWLSRPIPAKNKDLNFKRVLCFEPRRKGRPSEEVTDIFQALAPFVFAEPHIKSVAMPIVAAGDQQQPIAEMVPALLDAAFHWLKQGFPVETLKLVVYGRENLPEVKALFGKRSAALWKLNDFSVWEGTREGGEGTAVSPLGYDVQDGVDRIPPSFSRVDEEEHEFDVFISYSRVDEVAAQHFYKCLKDAGLRVFIDRMEVQVGTVWPDKIFRAMDKCNIIAVLYSPSFLESRVCKFEFNIAVARKFDTDRELIFPLLVRDTSLPTYMKLFQYRDCRISDEAKIATAADQLAESLRPPR